MKAVVCTLSAPMLPDRDHGRPLSLGDGRHDGDRRVIRTLTPGLTRHTPLVLSDTGLSALKGGAEFDDP